MVDLLNPLITILLIKLYNYVTTHNYPKHSITSFSCFSQTRYRNNIFDKYYSHHNWMDSWSDTCIYSEWLGYLLISRWSWQRASPSLQYRRTMHVKKDYLLMSRWSWQRSALKIKNPHLKIQASLILRKGFLFIRDRTRIRTWDRLLRRQVLYPAELCDHSICQGDRFILWSSIEYHKSMPSCF